MAEPRITHRWAGWLLAAVAAAAAALLVWTLPQSPPAVPPQPRAPAAAPSAVPHATMAPPLAAVLRAAPAVAPSFDIVRISPDGAAVLAGRSHAGARVVVADGGRTIAETQADAQGQWVALPATKLRPGGHELTLSAATDQPAGPPTAAAAPVLLVIPAAGHAAPSGPLALLAPEAAMPRLLQAPVATAAAAGMAAPLPLPALPLAAFGPGSRLGLGLVDYDAHGAIRFAGTAPPGSAVRIYVDRRAAGDARADELGHWMLQPAAGIGAGQHQLRLDQLASNGSVSARVALPFERVLLADGAVLAGKLVVQPGASLWRIARHVYGHGIRYTVIYLANRSQIRNPALIYPGQVFALPTPPPGAASAPNPIPASSITPR